MLIEEKIPLIFGVPAEAFYNKFSNDKVFVAELRPELSGMTTVANALLKRLILPVVICDNMMAFCMERGLVSAVYCFYDSLNEKSALCRTGSYVAALCAAKHGISVHLMKGAGIKPPQASLLKIGGLNVTAQDIKTYVPLFEEVPLDLVKLRP